MSNPHPDIRFAWRNEIDPQRWDHRIETSPHGLIYAKTGWLDIMAENWSALIEGDYERVMPLPWKRKYGFYYLYQPYFIKSLGVFGPTDQPFEISAFLHKIPDRYIYWDIDLNECNFVSHADRELKLRQYGRTNYFLPLGKNYETLARQYKRLAARMMRKATESQLVVSREADPSQIISLYRKGYAARHPRITGAVYEKLIRASEAAMANNEAEAWVTLTSDGRIAAYYLVLKDERFIYSLLGGSTEEGKTLGAFYFLTDAIIRRHAGSGRVFRFEGSDIPGVSFFDALFGPEKMSYPHLVMNHLPFPFRLFK